MLTQAMQKGGGEVFGTLLSPARGFFLVGVDTRVCGRVITSITNMIKIVSYTLQ